MDSLNIQFPDNPLHRFGAFVLNGITFLAHASITWLHAQLHGGRLFINKSIGTIATSGASVYFVIYPPTIDVDKETSHLGWSISAAGNAEVYLYEGGTPDTVGAALTLHNKNRLATATHVAKTVIKPAATTPTVLGTELEADFVTTNKKSKASLDAMEWVLSSTSTAPQVYILQIKALENNLKYGAALALYEPK